MEPVFVSLKSILKNGEPGFFWIGRPQKEVIELLGSPDAVGGTSRRYKTPAVFKYGDIEFFFDRQYPFVCTAFHIERSSGATFQFPDGWTIADWKLDPEHHYEDVMSYLKKNEITYSENKSGEIKTVKIPTVRGECLLAFD